MRYVAVHFQTPMRSAGRCIYCPATDELSDEHVIPFALGGNLYVPNASCPQCRNLTSRFERRVLRGFMYPARVAGNFPTRRPQERPQQRKVTLLDEGQPRDVLLPREAASAVLQLPLFEPPRFLTGKPKIQGINVHGTETIRFGADLTALVRDQGATSFRPTDTLDVTEFARMLAKIGYSYTVGLYGPVPLDDILVVPLIRGESDDAGHWVGSADFSTESERHGALHAVTHEVYEADEALPKRVLVARIKLFASAGATGYEVVVRKF